MLFCIELYSQGVWPLWHGKRANDVEREERKNCSIADRCFMRQNLGSQREKASDPHLKSTDGEREIEQVQARGAHGVGSEHDTAKLKNEHREEHTRVSQTHTDTQCAARDELGGIQLTAH